MSPTTCQRGQQGDGAVEETSLRLARAPSEGQKRCLPEGEPGEGAGEVEDCPLQEPAREADATPRGGGAAYEELVDRVGLELGCIVGIRVAAG